MRHFLQLSFWCVLLTSLWYPAHSQMMPTLGSLEFKEDFGERARRWDASNEWSVVDGHYEFRSPNADQNSFAVPRRAPLLDEQTLSVTVNVRERLAKTGWSLAGINLYSDPASFWFLGLVEDANGRRTVDFVESHNGVWQAQNEGETKLTLSNSTRTTPWQPNRDYSLRLQLERTGIAATVTDVANQEVIATGRYDFGTSPAVRSGAVGLMARGMMATFDDIEVMAPATRAAASAGLTIEQGTRGQVAILRDALPGSDAANTDRIAGALRASGFGVTPLSAAQVSDPAILTAARFSMLAVPNARYYPADGGNALNGYLRRGGRLLLLGGAPFTKPVWRYQNEWLDRETIQTRLRQLPTSNTFLDFDKTTDVKSWTRATNDAAIASSLTVDNDGPNGQGQSLKVAMANMTGWNNYASPVMENVLPTGHDTLTFWAKGDARTTQLSVEVNERDGSRWIAVVPLTTQWAYHVLAPEDFLYWKDARVTVPRGNTGDRFSPTNMTRVIVGLAESHTSAVGPGAHTFWVARFGSLVNPFQGVEKASQGFPAIETVTPSYKHYPLRDVASIVPAPGQTIVTDAVPGKVAAHSAIARPTVAGFGNNRKWRYIPLLQAKDGKGQMRGTPGWILFNLALPLVGSGVAVLALDDPAQFQSPSVLKMVVAAANRLQEGVFFTEAGSRQFSYWTGEKVELGASVANWGGAPADLRVRFTITDKASKRALFTVEEALRVAADENQSLTRTWDAAGHKGQLCEVTTELVRNGQTIDRISHEIGFLSSTAPARDEFVTTRGTNFMLRGRPWYPVGMNYWPLYVSGMEPHDYNAGWLKPTFYDPAEIERDLQKMQALGINMVSIQVSGLESQRNLLDFLRRCRPHNIYVNVFLGAASPIAFQEAELATYLNAGRLAQNPTVFAYDIIWEPGNWMFDAEHRPQWDRDWEAWIIERYGSLAAAEADWGRAVPRGNGKVVSPSDQQLRTDGEWRVMVAAYRRFMDDLMSRKWNDATTRLRRLDPNHLISFRQGNTLPQDFAFTATPKHIDFICPEGYAIPVGEPGHNAAGFVTRYVHFTTRGKPIVWSEFGKSVWNSDKMQPDESAIQRVADYHELFYRVVLEAGANGTVPWWWPGGYRINERSDFGVMNLDGTPRPMAEMIARYSPQIQKPRTYPAPNTFLTIDRDTHAGGYWYLTFNDGADAYSAARKTGKNLGLRTEGTDTDSCTTPLVAVGNKPYTGRNPLKYLNAEFNRLEIQNASGQWVAIHNGSDVQVKAGQPVRVRTSVGNIQEATWLTPASANSRPGAVFLAAVEGSDLTFRRAITVNTAYLADADFGEFTLTPAVNKSTRVILQMNAENRGWFGEKRQFTLTPVD